MSTGTETELAPDPVGYLKHRQQLLSRVALMIFVGAACAASPAVLRLLKILPSAVYPDASELGQVLAVLATLTIAISAVAYTLEKDRRGEHQHPVIATRFVLLELTAIICGLLAAVAGSYAFVHLVQNRELISISQTFVAIVIVILSVIAADTVPQDVLSQATATERADTEGWTRRASDHWSTSTDGTPNARPAPTGARRLWVAAMTLTPGVLGTAATVWFGGNIGVAISAGILWAITTLITAGAFRAYLRREWHTLPLLCTAAVLYLVLFAEACNVSMSGQHQAELAPIWAASVVLTAAALTSSVGRSRPGTLTPFQTLVAGWMDKLHNQAVTATQRHSNSIATRRRGSKTRQHLNHWAQRHANATGRISSTPKPTTTNIAPEVRPS